MNARQKEVLEQSLKDEQAVLDALTKNYTSALADIRKNIRELQANPLTQSKAYQLEYQKQLEKQISGVLDNLQGKNFNSIASYLQTCYETGFVGNMYDMQGQGVPLVIPIDEGQVLKAVQKTGDDFRLSNKLSGNTTELKKQVKSELQRGLASQLSYADIARNISNYGQADMNRSMRIARTEGHRVQSEARLDSMYAAKKKGADIVKQWDATLDGQTRPNHRQLDGQIRELDEPFEVSGMKVDCPGGFGIASEDCNCRCCVLQRARWAVKSETTYQKWNNETGGFIETTGYQDFKEKYLKEAQKISSKTPVLKKSKENAIINMGTLSDNAKLGQTHSDAMKSILSDAPEQIQTTWNSFVDRLDVEEAHSRRGAWCNYTKGITLDIDKVSKGEKTVSRITHDWEQGKKPYYTAFHEFGHNISSLMAKDQTGYSFGDIADVYKSKKFFREIIGSDGNPTKVGYTLTGMMKKEGNEYFNSVFTKLKEKAKADGLSVKTVRKQDAWNAIKQEILEKPIVSCSDISDMWDGISNGSCLAHYGHTNQKKSYWKDISVGTEGFAEMFSATVMNPGSVEQIQHYFPKSYELFLEILKELR